MNTFPGGESWNGVPWEERTGASVWTPPSFDPQTGLAYFGTGNTYDTGALLPAMLVPPPGTSRPITWNCTRWM